MTLTSAPMVNHLSPEQGRTLRVMSDRVTFKVTAAETNQAFSLFETVTPPQGGTPPHLQQQEDEAFYVLEGSYTFLVGAQRHTLTAGSFAFIPRGTVHAFTNTGDTPARMLIMTTPGGIHEQFFSAVGTPWDDQAAPATPDIPRLVAAAQQHGIVILPPDAAPQPAVQSAGTAMVYPAGAGSTRVHVQGATVTYKVDSADTDGEWALIEYTAPPRFRGPAPHWHRQTIEVFYLLTGSLTFEVAGETFQAGRGSTLVIPPGVVHTLHNPTSEPATYLTFFAPGGFARYFEELAFLMASEPIWPPADMGKLTALTAKYDQFSPDARR